MLCQIDQIWLPLHYLGYDFTKFLVNNIRFRNVKVTIFFGQFDTTFFTVQCHVAFPDAPKGEALHPMSHPDPQDFVREESDVSLQQ